MTAIVDWCFERAHNFRIGWNALMYEFGWDSLMIGQNDEVD